MLRPVELLRGGMKFGDAKFSYVIAGMGMGMATWRQRSFHTQETKKKNNELFWQNLKFVRVLQTPSKTPFDALSLSLAATCISSCCSSAVIWSDRDSSSDGTSALAHGIKSDYSSHHLRVRLLDQIVVAVC